MLRFADESISLICMFCRFVSVSVGDFIFASYLSILLASSQHVTLGLAACQQPHHTTMYT